MNRGLNRGLRGLMLVEPDPSGETGGGGAGGSAEGGKPEGDKPPAEKTLTQAEVTAIATREKAEGRKAAERELSEKLGVPLEDAQSIVAAHLKAQEDAKSEAQKEREAAEREKQGATSEKDAAKNEVHQTRLERAFLRAGVDLEDGDDKAKRLLRMVTVEAGASYEDVLKDVQQLKADFPALFDAKTEEKPKRRAPGGDPAGQPPKPTGGEDKFAAGRERAKNAGKRIIR